MPIVNQERWSHVQFFSERDFLELGTRSNGAKIIQIGTKGDEPIVAVAHTDDPRSEDLNPVELYSLLKMSYDHYTFYDKPKKVVRNLKTVHKYEIPTSGEFSLELPIDAEILTVQIQKDKTCIWVLISTEKPINENGQKQRNFCWVRTSEPIGYTDLTYLATLQFNAGDHVVHLFEVLEKDYSHLKNLLAAQKWEEADKETFAILLQLCGEVRNPDGSFVSQEGIKELRCSDLRTIDDLWLKYSNGRFGYSVQQRIWQSLGGTRETKIEDRHDELWNSFCKRVRWNKAFPALTFTLKAPEGHLPAIIAWGMGCSPALLGEVYASLFSRIEDCKF
jgi:hypothetical protein